MAMTTEAIAQLADAIRQQTLSQAEKIPPQPPVAAVAFKAPPFWTTNASAWFLRLEATFATHTPPITNDLTKFHHVVQFPRLSQDPCVSEQQDPHALQEDHTAMMGDAVGPDRAATSDDAQGIAPAPAPSSLSDASPPQVTTRSGRLVQKPKKYRTFYRLS